MPGPPWCLLNGNYYSSTEPPAETPSFLGTPVLTRSRMLGVPLAQFAALLVVPHTYRVTQRLSVFLTHPFPQCQVAGLVPVLVEH